MNKQDIKLIAHGGYSAKFPENTLQSYLEASKYNPYAIEMDVVLNPKTNTLICYHPTGLSSTQGTYTTSQLEDTLDQSYAYPIFSNVLNILPKTQKISIDFKSPSEETFKEALKIVGDDISRYIFEMRSIEDFRMIKGMNMGIKSLALFSNPDDYIDFSNENGNYFRLWEKDVTKERVEQIHKRNLEVWITPGYKATETTRRTAGEITPTRLKELIDLDIDAVFVNDIEIGNVV